MRAALVAALCLLAALTPAAAADSAVLSVAAEPADKPWWQRAAWTPRAATVRGVPIKRLHPDWCAAQELTRQVLDAAVGPLMVDAAMDGRTFVLEGDFNGSGVTQQAFVGAYRRCAGEQGLFVAIVESTRERVRMRFLVEVPDPGSALALLAREPDGTLAVWWCADCASGNRIGFNRQTREFFVAGPATRR